MNKSHKIWRIVGLVLHVLIGALLVFAGAMKLLGMIPKEQMEQLREVGVADSIQLIGAGELVSGILLVVPITSSLGLLLVTGFWGGVISFHMTHHEGYAPYAVMLLVTWLGAYLREPATFASFFRHREVASGPPEAAS